MSHCPKSSRSITPPHLLSGPWLETRVPSSPIPAGRSFLCASLPLSALNLCRILTWLVAVVGEATVALTHAAHSIHSREEALEPFTRGGSGKRGPSQPLHKSYGRRPEVVSCQLAKLIARVRAGDVAQRLTIWHSACTNSIRGRRRALCLPAQSRDLHPGEALYLGANEPHAYISASASNAWPLATTSCAPASPRN